MGGSGRLRIASWAVCVVLAVGPGCEALFDVPDPRLVDVDAAALLTLRVSASGTAGTRGLSVRITGPDGLDCPGSCVLAARAGTSITLEAASVQGAVFRGWRGAAAACADAATCTFTVTAAGELSARWDLPSNVAFVSSREYTADFGRGGDAHGFADGECAALAAAADLPPGPYVAWLGTSVESAAMHLPEVSGWVRPDGESFALDRSALLAGHILYPVRLDERGADVGEALLFTGALADGATDVNCTDWTKGPPAGGGFVGVPFVAGDPGGGTVTWTDTGGFDDCGTPGRLLCLGIGVTDAPPAAPAPPVITPDNETDLGRIWVSKGTMTPGPGGGFGAASSLCTAEGVDRQAIALVAETGFAAGLRVLRLADQEAPVRFVRPDGVAVAASFLDLADGRLLAAPNLTVDGDFVGPDAPVWLGSGTLATGSPIQACGGQWQDGDGGLFGRAASVTSSFVRGDQQLPCSEAHRVLCVDFPLRQL